jgi:hypothetical protein
MRIGTYGVRMGLLNPRQRTGIVNAVERPLVNPPRLLHDVMRSGPLHEMRRMPMRESPLVMTFRRFGIQTLEVQYGTGSLP